MESTQSEAWHHDASYENTRALVPTQESKATGSSGRIDARRSAFCQVRRRTAARGFRITGPLAAQRRKGARRACQVPSFQKAGIKGLVIEPWFGVFIGHRRAQEADR
jgi:hypothetical protein